MKNKNYFYKHDLTLHIFYWTLFCFCIISWIAYFSGSRNLIYLAIFSVSLTIIAFARLSLRLVECEKIIKTYERKNKK